MDMVNRGREVMSANWMGGENGPLFNAVVPCTTKEALLYATLFFLDEKGG